MRSKILLIALLFFMQITALPADEYLKGLLEVAQYQSDEFGQEELFVNAIELTLFKCYPDLHKQSSNLLLQVYEALPIREVYFSERKAWHKTIIHAYLRENSIDLSEIKRLQFADYHISVAAHDFDADASDEYILDISKGQPQNREDCNSAEYLDYLVVQQREDGYTFIETSISPLGGGGQEPGIKELRVEDINADGLPEWVLAYGGLGFGGSGMGYVSFGKLYLLGWRNNQLVSLAPEFEWTRLHETLAYEESDGMGCPTLSYSVTWAFENMDDDAPLEILQDQIFLDNWFCETRFTKRFDWSESDDSYKFIRSSRELRMDTQNCQQRKGEEAMWRGAYLEGIAYFERGLALPQYEVGQDREDSLTTINQYLRSRLALAYILTNREAEARLLLETLTAEAFSSEPLREFADVLNANVDDPPQACFGAFEVFTRLYPRHYLGVTIELDTDPREYVPERIGCNAPPMVDEMLAETVFTTNPITQLEILGLSVKESLVLDFNQDGQDEILVWLDLPVTPIFFALEGDIYLMSRPPVDPYRKADYSETRLLPDDGGTALLFMDSHLTPYYKDQPPWKFVWDRIGEVTGGEGYSSCITSKREIYLRLWRMEGSELQQIFSTYLCQDDLSKIFPEGEPSRILDGGEERIANVVPIIREVRYVWDSETNGYQLPRLPPQTPTTSPPSPTPTVEPKYRFIDEAFLAEDYEAVIDMTETAIKQAQTPETFDSLQYNRYLQAFALEMLGRYAEADAMYRAIVTSAPQTVWGELAALHLDIR